MSGETLRQISRHPLALKDIQDVAPYIKRYESEPHTPELINETWRGFFGDKYEVPLCDRSAEEIVILEKKGRRVLLLPDEIFKPEGLVKLCEDIHWMRDSWVIDPKNAQKIRHSSIEGGCIDVEMQITPPYTTPNGYNEKELMKRIEGIHRRGQRISTYIVNSRFNELLRGLPLDINNTSSRITGSRYENQALTVSFNLEGQLDVLFEHPDQRRPSLGGRSESIISEKRNFWQTHHLGGHLGRKA